MRSVTILKWRWMPSIAMDGVGNVCDVCPGSDDSVDTDNDGVPDGCDPCPLDNPDDSDFDGTPDCIDGCADDPAKIAPGFCGCGVVDADGDFDGTPDCIDGCPADPAKVDEGQCGCGVIDSDTDGDGTADCNDECVDDPDKIAPGDCGCGLPDIDSDGDGTTDRIDQHRRPLPADVRPRPQGAFLDVAVDAPRCGVRPPNARRRPVRSSGPCGATSRHRRC